MSRFSLLWLMGLSELLACGAPVDDASATATPALSTPTPVAELLSPIPFSTTGRIPNTTCRLSRFAEPPSQYELKRVFPDLYFDHPLQLVSPPDGSGLLYVAEKQGRIFAFDPSEESPVAIPVFDISGRVDSTTNQDMGLLSFVFHPLFGVTGTLVVHYTAANPFRVVVSRFPRSKDDPLTFDVSAEEVILEVPLDAYSHNGGTVAFGPDGFLYVSLGDGGGQRDPYRNAQDLGDLHGKVLRIDVDHPSPEQGYSVPADNPFVGIEGARPEIWALGLRNPFRMSFDRKTGDLWLGDVGQDAWEEVDIIVRGGNYGWSMMEGNHCYRPDEECAPELYLPPVWEYPHTEGTCVIGGVVYRGKQFEELDGQYIYADYSNGRVFALRSRDGVALENRILFDSGTVPVALGEDQAGEVYLVSHGGGLQQLVRVETQNNPFPFPQRLSETRCFVDVPGRVPAPGVLPYDVNSPLWSDGEAKRRWVALPGLERMNNPAEGPWTFPEGTIFFKDFGVYTIEGDVSSFRLLETRLLMTLGDEWRGYSYRWQEDQKDAVLLEGSFTESVDITTYSGEVLPHQHDYPSRANCQQCHTPAAGYALGIRTGQLDPDFQRDHLAEQGWLTQPLPEMLERFIWTNPTDESLDVTLRARSYLAANCSHCHQPGGPTPSRMDLRFEIPLNLMGVCDVPSAYGDLGLEDLKIVEPGSPDTSAMVLRMEKGDTYRMPPLATHMVDERGSQVIRQWIQSLITCPNPASPLEIEAPSDHSVE